MYLDEYKEKPVFESLILLKISGYFRLKESKKNWVSDNITEQFVSVYNMETDMVSDKSVYMSKQGEAFIKNKGKRVYLKEFVKGVG